MKNFMSKFFKSSLISSIGLTILGALLFFQSEFTIVSISYIIGGILIAIGVLAVLKFVNNMNNNTKNELDIVYGVVTVILGIIVISNPKAVASIIPFVIGFIIIISSATKLQYSLELKRDNNNLWKATMTMAIITMLCGILLIFNPFKGAEFITKVIGALIFVYAILDIISTITIKSTVDQIQHAIEEKTISEAVVLEENVETTKVEEDEEKSKPSKKNKKSKRKNKEEE